MEKTVLYASQLIPAKWKLTVAMETTVLYASQLILAK
jgi:hypothetical protein